MTGPGGRLRRMVRDLRSLRAPYWETLLVVDDVNRGLFALQERLKGGAPHPSEALATWQRLRDFMDRHMRTLAPEQILSSPPERALRTLREGLETIVGSWDLTQSQRDRLEGLLSRAAREHLGAEAAAA